MKEDLKRIKSLKDGGRNDVENSIDAALVLFYFIFFILFIFFRKKIMQLGKIRVF